MPASASEIDGLIQRLDAWLQQNRPEYYASLNPGASDEEIAELETSLGWNLPEDFVKFYKWRNGINELVPGWVWMSLIHISEIRAWHLEYMKNESFSKNQRWHPDFVPFLENGAGDYYCLDRCGVWNGQIYQIILSVHDDRSQIEAPNFNSWLEVIVQCHESGAWIREQDQVFCDFEQSDGWSATYVKISSKVSPEYPKEEVW